MRVTPCLLIVEDDRLLAMDLEEMAIRLGWRVVGPTHDLVEALDAAKNEQIDFALLDFNLASGTTSIPVAEALSERKVGYCFVTAAPLDEVREVNPAAPIITKPMALFELQRVLNSVRQ